MILKAGGDTRARAQGRSATLPIHFWNHIPRVAHVILEWEEKHGIEPIPVEYDISLGVIYEAVKNYREKGDPGGGMPNFLSAGTVYHSDYGPEGLEALKGRAAGVAAKQMEYMEKMSKLDHKRKMCSSPDCPHKGALAEAGGRFDMKKCAKCKQAYYCSRECQMRHWKSGHRRECKELCAAASASS
mmetsp:Transcript_17840/g.38921  ORF Transcript_17840/g.38921 Transcript_17840/m.38921 type:complete len:186 (-) Transcript_17840:171-728(-)